MKFAKSQRRKFGVALALVALLTQTGCGGASDANGDLPALRATEGPWQGAIVQIGLKVGENHIEFDLTNEQGEPLDGANVEISPWMPAHGHGSVDIVAAEVTPGHYVSDELYFNMPGLWELRFHVTGVSGEGRLVASLEVP